MSRVVMYVAYTDDEKKDGYVDCCVESEMNVDSGLPDYHHIYLSFLDLCTFNTEKLRLQLDLE